MEIQRLGPRPSGTAGIATLSRARRGLLELLEGQAEPASLATIVELSGLHENTVRGHLDGLAAEGLVSRERSVPQGRGRPAWLWRVRARAAAEEYAGLAAALARTLRRTSEHPEDDAVEAGHDWGRELAGSRAATAAAAPAAAHVRDLLESLGFAPEGDLAAGADSAELRLTRCPLLEAATEEPTIVCNVHLGLVVGALEEYGASDPDAELTPFAVPGACLLRLRGGAA
ncbi:helix-turn-helix transcriptional regulator [Nocardioides sp.]|uniref:helix-turn-helix transcriptional regulator n=1 Tax=Nocardioides sp. TaxID=35761 RepID=UPI002BF733DF|nr:helix-turn-helix domain-containing protein [Nocardioides sp.]HVX53373.1 helix-turn-helix domain-containing protein [Nocardioides sp.]